MTTPKLEAISQLHPMTHLNPPIYHPQVYSHNKKPLGLNIMVPFERIITHDDTAIHKIDSRSLQPETIEAILQLRLHDSITDSATHNTSTT